MDLGLVFWIVILFKHCAESAKNIHSFDRIVGGVPANITEFPYQLAVEHKVTGLRGAATIITKTWALTAAHVLKGVDTNSLVLRSGSSYSLKGGTVHQIAKALIHVNFRGSTLDYDVGVVKVKNPFTFNAVTQRIPMAETSPRPGTAAVASGWGHTRAGGDLADQLQKVTVYVIDYKKCKQRYKDELTPRMLCAEFPSGGKDSCQGDSGGPLVANGKLVGIVSWGRGCAVKENPGVYTDVAKLRQWVIRTTNRY